MDNSTACIKYTGENIQLTTWTPIKYDMKKFPHVVLSSRNPWDTHTIKFPYISYSDKGGIESKFNTSCGISGIQMYSTIHEKGVSNRYPKTVIFNPDDFNQRVVNSVRASTSKAENQRSAFLSAMNLVIQADAVDCKINRTVRELKTWWPLKESQLQPFKYFVSKEAFIHNNIIT